MPRGLVLVTGVTGSGKSTTLAAMVDRVNSSRAEHIITMKIQSNFCIATKRLCEPARNRSGYAVVQRGVARFSPSRSGRDSGRRNARSGNDFHCAARSGNGPHGFLYVAHAGCSGNGQSNHFYFPAPEQKQIRLQLAAVLRAIVSQRLVRRCDSEGRVPAVEVMINTAFIRECVLVPEKTRSIRDAIAAGTSQYGCRLSISLYGIYSRRGWSPTKRRSKTPPTPTTSSCACRELRRRRTFRASLCSRRDLADGKAGFRLRPVGLRAR